MNYMLLVHHNEATFAKMIEAAKKDLLVESIQLCHQLNGKGQIRCRKATRSAFSSVLSTQHFWTIEEAILTDKTT